MIILIKYRWLIDWGEDTLGNDLENANKIIQGELVVGNHDSLLVFGNDAQIGLNEFSKSVSNIITKNNNELEDIIADLS